MTQQPIAQQKYNIVKFEKVNGENKENNPMDPPIEMNDPYFWMRDDERENPEVLDWIKTENKYFVKSMHSPLLCTSNTVAYIWLFKQVIIIPTLTRKKKTPAHHNSKKTLFPLNSNWYPQYNQWT